MACPTVLVVTDSIKTYAAFIEKSRGANILLRRGRMVRITRENQLDGMSPYGVILLALEPTKSPTSAQILFSWASRHRDAFPPGSGKWLKQEPVVWMSAPAPARDPWVSRFYRAYQDICVDQITDPVARISTSSYLTTYLSSSGESGFSTSELDETRRQFANDTMEQLNYILEKVMVNGAITESPAPTPPDQEQHHMTPPPSLNPRSVHARRDIDPADL
jgi:hypothetical protein